MLPSMLESLFFFFFFFGLAISLFEAERKRKRERERKRLISNDFFCIVGDDVYVVTHQRG